MTGFVFSDFLMKKRGHKNENDEIGEKDRFTVSA
jgi:hypothetical protein